MSSHFMTNNNNFQHLPGTAASVVLMDHKKKPNKKNLSFILSSLLRNMIITITEFISKHCPIEKCKYSPPVYHPFKHLKSKVKDYFFYNYLVLFYEI